MGHAVQRLGFRITRGWATLLLIVAGLVGLAFWVGPLRPLPAELQLLAIDGDSVTTAVAAVPRRDTVSGGYRFGVALAVRNVGADVARPYRLMLSVPGHFRLATRAGPLAADVTPGVPLRRYRLDLPPEVLPPDSSLRRVTGVDTLWIEPDLASWYCTTQGDNIPEFVPAPPRNPETLSQLRIFYSIRTRRADEHHSGLISVSVPPEALRVETAALPPSFPTTFREPEAPAPQLGTMYYEGGGTVWCGDLDQPMELYSAVYRNDAGARFVVVYVHGTARKRLYDVNGDGIVDVETWDLNGDGRFEARRDARFRIPELLLPPPPRLAELRQPLREEPDSAWLGVFGDAGRGLGRFAQLQRMREEEAAARQRALALAADTLPADTVPAGIAAADSIAGDTVRTPARTLAWDTAGVPRPTAEWIALFGNTAAGPFRFSQPALRPAALDVSADTATADTATPPPPPRPRPRPRPLGVPVTGG